MSSSPLIRDMYDLLPPPRGVELRRRNLERLAALDVEAAERRVRLAIVAALLAAPPREA